MGLVGKKGHLVSRIPADKPVIIGKQAVIIQPLALGIQLLDVLGVILQAVLAAGLDFFGCNQI